LRASLQRLRTAPFWILNWRRRSLFKRARFSPNLFKLSDDKTLAQELGGVKPGLKAAAELPPSVVGL
jgi:hypothetical protein